MSSQKDKGFRESEEVEVEGQRKVSQRSKEKAINSIRFAVMENADDH